MDGQQMTVQLFLMKLSFSRLHFHDNFPVRETGIILLGHVRAFEFFAGVPALHQLRQPQDGCRGVQKQTAVEQQPSTIFVDCIVREPFLHTWRW